MYKIFRAIPLPLPKQKLLDFAKLKEFADDNLNSMKMVESSPKR